MARRFGIVVLALGAIAGVSACGGKTTGVTKVNDHAATLHATASCGKDEKCLWYWQYWQAGGPRAYGVTTGLQGPITGPTSNVNLSTRITNLVPGTTYDWVLCGSPNDGTTFACAGPHGTVGSSTADPPPDYATFTTAEAPQPLAERWNAKGWRILNAPNASGAERGALAAVSCTSPTTCTAVGDYFNSTFTEVALADRSNGRTWMVQTVPAPSGATGSYLNAISCTSATACTAVGSAAISGVFVTLAESWNGSAWTIQPTPNPSGTLSATLNGVSCTSPTACTAVGTWSGPYPSGGPLVERWDGTSWTIQATPSGGDLSAVSCTSVTACTAVGSASGQTLAERWDGTTWTVQPTPNPSSSTGFSGVSCTSATRCTAVGSSDAEPLAESWDGTSWTIQPTPHPTSKYGNSLLGVSCASATACTAVGDITGTALALAERWDGTAWTLQTVAASGGTDNLNGVSCPSATRCTAVGSQ